MAKYSLKNNNSVEGNFFVDTHCIGCNTCVRLAPETFMLKDDLSYVKLQPSNKKELDNATLALLSCPVFSIGMKENKQNINKVANTLPLLLEEDVYFCSYNSEKSYGANSYFIKRDKGNILVDSPRYNTPLVKALEKLGGLDYIYLTHVDDVADYKKFKTHFNAKVIYHEDDFSDSIKEAEITLKGSEVYHLDEEVKIIPQSGHTKGHTVLLYKDHYLFSGDNLSYNSEINALTASKDYCWYDWETQLNSLEKLLDFDFDYILPGHGGSIKSDADTLKKMLKDSLNYYG
ncbi:MAG: MBL fold metallo-hydrolase [Campylobacteraceae bacterium]|nr:MBL fold metallo-hydrolase [Campylobacteraceae bacterium]